MTQVTNLTAGMAVSAKGDASFLKHDQSQLVLEEFASIMNQNAQSFMNTAVDHGAHSSGLSDDRAPMSGITDAPVKDFEKYGSSGGRKITQAQTERADGEVVSQKVQDLADEVKKVVQETMQVSEEDIEQAMETLGLGMFDLLQPQNLIGLVQELTGSTDVSALLTNENFQITMQEVTGLIADFQQKNGFNATQFSDLLEQLSVQIDELEEAVKELLNVHETSGSEQVTDTQTIGMSELPAADAELPEESVRTVHETVKMTDQQHTAVQYAQENPEQRSDQVAEQPATMAVEEAPEQTAQSTGQEENPAFQNGKSKPQSDPVGAEQEKMTTEQHAGIFRTDTAMMANEQTATVTPDTPQVQGYIELEHLMDQLEGLARTFASAEGTTVEMQLNPESLGRLVLTVTERHGNVTAQITASNEQVKEALQTQMVELQSTLQAQGVKVEAVEVTVATHEFEQNLDGNTSANGQMQEQTGEQNAGGQSGRRNLNRNSLDELSGLMSEEETLVAQMMRDNGGTVDFTA